MATSMTERTGERRGWFEYFRKSADEVDCNGDLLAREQTGSNDLMEFTEDSDSSSDSNVDLESDFDSETTLWQGGNASQNSSRTRQLPVSEVNGGDRTDEDEEEEEEDNVENDNDFDDDDGEELDDTATIVPQTVPCTLKQLRALEERVQFLEEIFDLLTVKLSQKRESRR